MSDVTQILDAMGRGEPQAADQLLPMVYDDLRRLAAQRLDCEPPGQTLDATARVHEAYLRLVGGDPGRAWQGRTHFFAAAAEAMRRILVEKRGANDGSSTAAVCTGRGRSGRVAGAGDPIPR
jgi:RNA polymerase sigma factor (TIGR02999 family)